MIILKYHTISITFNIFLGKFNKIAILTSNSTRG